MSCKQSAYKILPWQMFGEHKNLYFYLEHLIKNGNAARNMLTIFNQLIYGLFVLLSVQKIQTLLYLAHLWASFRFKSTSLATITIFIHFFALSESLSTSMGSAYSSSSIFGYSFNLPVY